jgi:GntR family transcriptional regulator, rspAB operon transcriptional repressor
MLHVKNIQFSIPVVYQYCSAGIPDTSILLSIDLPKMSELRRKREGAHRLRPLKSHPGEPEALAVSTLAERIYQKLKSDIIHNFFQAGEAINEKVLATRYKGSRTPVREAIMRLQQENLLRLVPQKGYFVSHLTIHELNEMYEYRGELEAFCAELAARRWADEAELKRLTELAQTKYETRNRGSYETFIERDTECHISIAKLARNRLLLRAVADVRSHMERIMYAAIDIGYYGEVPASEHSQIIEAIRARDAAFARRSMYDHIVGSKQKVLRLAAASDAVPAL